MPMKLTGSCQCGAIHFTVLSHTPVPYQLCACSICRKVAGYSGSVNLGAINSTLEIQKGLENIKKYQAIKRDGQSETKCSSERSFCSLCSTMLWLWDHHWPSLIHPFASAIDSTDSQEHNYTLPVPQEMVCIMAGSKPAWVRWPEGEKRVCEGYNGEVGIEDWHRKGGVWVE